MVMVWCGMVIGLVAHFLGGSPPIMWMNAIAATKTIVMKSHIGGVSFPPDIMGPRGRARQDFVGDHGIRRAGRRLRWSGCSSGKLMQAYGPCNLIDISSYARAASSGVLYEPW